MQLIPTASEPMISAYNIVEALAVHFGRGDDYENKDTPSQG